MLKSPRPRLRLTRSVPTTMPILLVVAGPNGCGRSTLTRMSIFRGLEIIDPDAIARGMLTGGPVQAAREALRRRRDALAASQSHLVKRTLAGSGILRHMAAAWRAGYRIVLHYVSVGAPDQSLDRIRNRVALGDHDVPEADARRRLVRSHANLPAGMARTDLTLLYDNIDPNRPHREVTILGDGKRWIAGAISSRAVEALARN